MQVRNAKYLEISIYGPVLMSSSTQRIIISSTTINWSTINTTILKINLGSKSIKQKERDTGPQTKSSAACLAWKVTFGLKTHLQKSHKINGINAKSNKRCISNKKTCPSHLHTSVRLSLTSFFLLFGYTFQPPKTSKIKRFSFVQPGEKYNGVQ